MPSWLPHVSFDVDHHSLYSPTSPTGSRGCVGRNRIPSSNLSAQGAERLAMLASEASVRDACCNVHVGR